MGRASQKAKRGAGEAGGGPCGQYAPMTFFFGVHVELHVCKSITL
jgi:hypothetical protein